MPSPVAQVETRHALSLRTTILSLHPESVLNQLQQRIQIAQRICFRCNLVFPPSRHAGKTQSNSRLVSRRTVDSFKGDLKNKLWFYTSHRAKSFYCVQFHPAVNLANLFICQTTIGFRKRHELFAIPHSKSIIGIKVCSTTVSPHGVDHDGVNRERIDLPLPPVAATPSVSVNRIPAFKHDAFTEKLP